MGALPGPRGRDDEGALTAVLVVVLAAVLSAAAGLGAWYRSDPPPHHVWFGVHVDEGDPAAYEAYTAGSSRRPSVVSLFVRLDSPTLSARLRAVVERGQIPLVTLEPWSVTSPFGVPDQQAYALRTVAAGAHDPELRRIGHALAAVGGTVLLRFAHEANGDWYPWSVGRNGNTAASYVAAWKHVHSVIGSRAPHAQWIWAPAALQSTRGEDDLAAFYPGDALVDLVGMSGYARAPRQTPDQTFDRTLAALRALTSRPIVLAEVGAAGPTRTTWLHELGPWVQRQRDVVGLVYFNTSPATTGASGDYRVDDDPPARRALDSSLRQVVSRTR